MTGSYRLSDLKFEGEKGLGKVVSAFVLKERGKDARIYSEDGCLSVENRCDCNRECSCDKECRHCRCVDNPPAPCQCDDYEVCTSHTCRCFSYEPSPGNCRQCMDDCSMNY